MEAHSRTEDTPRSRGILEGQVRELYGRLVYTHKTQEKAADLLLARQSWVRFWQIVLSAASAGGFIAGAFGAGPWANIAGLTVSTVLLALNSYIKDYNIGELAQKHRQAAAHMWLMRERYLSLLVDIAMHEKPLESLQTQRDELTEELSKIYEAAPSTNSRAYKAAQKALQRNQDMTLSDDEIDAFLHRELKRQSRASAADALSSPPTPAAPQSARP